MGNILLHTPEGVRDIYNSEAKRKLVLQNSLSSAMESYGFDPIQTPSFEFFDIFSRDIGTTPSTSASPALPRDRHWFPLMPATGTT